MKVPAKVQGKKGAKAKSACGLELSIDAKTGALRFKRAKGRRCGDAQVKALEKALFQHGAIFSVKED